MTEPRNLPPSRRRDKPQLSCNLCRRRKLKCDRNQPCGSCRHRGLSLSCTYPQSTTSETRHIAKHSRQISSSGLTERIGQLEKLISSLVGDDARRKAPSQVDISYPSGPGPTKDPQPVKPENANDPSDSFGHISLRDSKTTYVQDTHWTAILDGITELRNSVQNETTSAQCQPVSSSRSPSMMFPSCKSATREEILSGLPPRELCDRLVADYFTNSSLPLIHGPSFLRRYEAFWENPHETHMMWIGKLYGVLSVPLIFQRHDDPTFQSKIEEFDHKINQCLIAGRYQDCPPDTIETLCCTLNTQFFQSGDGEMSSMVIMGVLARMAQRMGYHRDASHFPHISPFHGEMRRRVWTVITDLDTLLSTSAGLPRLLREFQSDTASPRNLLDEDFDEDSPELPPARPDSFQTPCQWLVAKNKVTSILGIVTDFATSIRRPTYVEVMRLDKILHETYLASPSNLLERPLSKSLLDNSETILHRYQLLLLVAKARCVLHYRYLAPARNDERYAYSRSSCIEASLKILESYHLIHRESRSGGRLYRERWKCKSPLLIGMTMLGTTLLCLELNYELSINPATNQKHQTLPESLKYQLIEALKISYAIWTEDKGSFPKSLQTMQAVELVFKKLAIQHHDISSSLSPGRTHSSNDCSTDDLTIDFFPGAPPSSWPALDGAMFLDQAMNLPHAQALDLNSPAPSFHIAPELLDLTNTMDEMLGISMNYPRMPDF
ncbi:hypothetical protein N7478_003522 [Penicillium angulare]|uniref:uncharacterized protein n=1 Tax=Penicillium angulare TaxID=116970 RepID=UPI002541369D|nr:uncharacterized protein N7478_003522 [Penicillium angulare]KAJ5287836.1 hypothetical protein N7478_003522 [Penicillium angulare]